MDTESGLDKIQGTILTFIWRHWGKPWTPSPTRTANLKVRTHKLHNTKHQLQCSVYTYKLWNVYPLGGGGPTTTITKPPPPQAVGMDYFAQICESTAERSEPEAKPSTSPNVLNPHQNTLLLLTGIVRPELITMDLFALQKQQQQCPYLQMPRMNILLRITHSPHNQCDGPFSCCFPNKPS